MKRIILPITLIAASLTANAQVFTQDSNNSEMLRPVGYNPSHRTEVVLPVVNGYNIYKADLHTHTIFSDGQVLPELRIREAWQDGIDVVAVTEHIEYRKHEGMLVDYLKNYTSKKTSEAVNYRIINGGLTEEGIKVDMNTSVKLSTKAAKDFGITIIPGSEITRDGTNIGHFNALFTKDNNTIYDPDPVQAIRNAKAQGALVMHNHPGWHKKSLNMTETEKTAYDEGLIDGVEVMNGAEFYPGIIDRVRERNIFISANTDVHRTTSEEYTQHGYTRPMTLIFAKDQSLESLKEALEQNRTLAYGFGVVCGEEQLLKDLFLASISTERISSKVIILTNKSSIPYTLKKKGKNQVVLPAFSSLRLTIAEGKSVDMTIMNMYNGAESHPTVEIK